MGTGKSQLIRKMIEKHDSVLYISCRKSFSAKISQEFGLTSYQDIDGMIVSFDIGMRKAVKVIVQVESLQRVVINEKHSKF